MSWGEAIAVSITRRHGRPVGEAGKRNGSVSRQALRAQ
jgi:hypothetical protein